MTVTFREMTIADIPASFELRFSTIENAITAAELKDNYGITPDTLADAMRTDTSGWVAEEDGRLVGYAMGSRANGEVLVVAVRPGHEGKGIGRTVLKHVVDWLKAEGHTEIWLCANPEPDIRATGFYRKLGWRRTGTMRGEDEVLRLEEV